MNNEVLGYKIIKTESDNIPYHLVGKRGGVYRLCRNQNDRRLLFVINQFGNVVGLKGNYTFTDYDGELRALSGGAWTIELVKTPEWAKGVSKDNVN